MNNFTGNKLAFVRSMQMDSKNSILSKFGGPLSASSQEFLTRYRAGLMVKT